LTNGWSLPVLIAHIIHVTPSTVTVAVPLCHSFVRHVRDRAIATVTRYRNPTTNEWSLNETIPLAWPRRDWSFAERGLIGEDGSLVYLHVIPILSFNDDTPVDEYAVHWDKPFYAHDSQLILNEVGENGKRQRASSSPDLVKGGGVILGEPTTVR
jgi:hypothetical protein